MTTTLSPQRQRLADLRAQHAAAIARIDEIQGQVATLDEIHTARDTARADIAAFDREQSASMTAFARGEAGKPKSTGSTRRKLIEALADAEAAAAAALLAQDELRGLMRAPSLERDAAEAQIAIAERLVVLEDAEALFPKMREAIKNYLVIRKTINDARRSVWSGPTSDAVSAALVAFNEQLALAETVTEDPAEKAERDRAIKRTVDMAAAQVVGAASAVMGA